MSWIRIGRKLCWLTVLLIALIGVVAASLLLWTGAASKPPGPGSAATMLVGVSLMLLAPWPALAAVRRQRADRRR